MSQKRKKGSSELISIGKGYNLSLNKGKYSRQLDSFKGYYDVIAPPYDVGLLIALSEQSDSLRQLSKAYSSNISGFGWTIKYQDGFDYNNADDNVKKQADTEWRKLELIYKYVNPKESFNDIMEKVLYDREILGYGVVEILRNLSGEVAQIEYCRASSIRICNNSDTKVEIKQWQENMEGKKLQVPVITHFNKFVQQVNGKKIYFKEFGDTRQLNCFTGEYGENINENELATELAFFNIHDGYSKYGSPRWIGATMSVAGNIISEKLNFKYFQAGRIIPSAILVSGGELTNASINNLKNARGIDHAFDLAILEASAFKDDESMTQSSSNQVKIDIKPFIDTDNKDALFQNYQRDNRGKVRDTFRLPPIYTGSSEDYTRATADTSKAIAEEQIFIPERKKVANVFNSIINNELGIKYCEMSFVNSEVSNISELTSALEPFIKAGTITPNMLIDVLGKVITKTLEPLPPEIGDTPFELVKIKYQQMINEEGTDKNQLSTIKVLTDMSQSIQKALGENHAG